MQFFKHLLSKLQANQNVYLLTVIQNSGSSPGRKGFKMLVSEDGFIYGSIGGGVMEFNLVEATKKLLQGKDHKILFKKQVHRGDKDHGSGMICSGEQTVVFHPLHATHIPMAEEILAALKSNTKGVLLLTPNAISFSGNQLEQKFDFQINNAEDWIFKEQIGFTNTLYLVGGGHVSLSVSELFVTLGFHVVVFDDRENLNTFEQNTHAHRKEIIDFQDIASYIPEDSQTYVAIMTNRYIDDKLVLSKLIHKKMAYLGVLGSTAKLKAMWEVLERDGVSQALLNKVNGPIGLSIKSQTPEEIAVSIAAEVIKVKNVRLR